MSTYGTDDAKASAELTEFLANRGNVRLYALIFGCALALVVLIGSVIIVPPPERKWPKKAPLCGCLPWCLISRLLGYGLVQWETGRMLRYVEYFKETHDLLSLVYGDMALIAKEVRYTVWCVDLCCNFAMTMALTDATGTIQGEDFIEDQLWVYVCIFVFQILFGIATRLSAIGVTMHDRLKEYMWFCAGISSFCLFCSVMYTNVLANRQCNSPCVAYNYTIVFFSAQALGFVLVQPAVLTIKFWLGWGLWYVCRGYLTFSDVAMVPEAVAKFKNQVSPAEHTVPGERSSMTEISLNEFQAIDEEGESGVLGIMASPASVGGVHSDRGSVPGGIRVGHIEQTPAVVMTGPTVAPHVLSPTSVVSSPRDVDHT